MSKIMVVEDDVNLREIYSIRIAAEGYEISSAGDGEEALAVAVREKPDLILADVMMPKISGFDMLDILRTTPETAKIKVIMMTALSGEDQRARGERLGAERYLVKSQVGIEDVVNVIHEVLGDRPSPAMNPGQNVTQGESPAASAPGQPVPPPVSQAPASGVPTNTWPNPSTANPQVNPVAASSQLSPKAQEFYGQPSNPAQ